MLRGFFNDNLGMPFIVGMNSNFEQNSKLYHDSYKVYVNSDFIGYKTLLAQNENIKDVEKYLRGNGFENFTAKVIGGECYIKSVGRETQDLKDTLGVYLNTR